jgi:hypothetical protein
MLQSPRSGRRISNSIKSIFGGSGSVAMPPLKSSADDPLSDAITATMLEELLKHAKEKRKTARTVAVDSVDDKDTSEKPGGVCDATVLEPIANARWLMHLVTCCRANAIVDTSVSGVCMYSMRVLRQEQRTMATRAATKETHSLRHVNPNLVDTRLCPQAKQSPSVSSVFVPCRSAVKYHRHYQHQHRHHRCKQQ